ncbi:FkbM family methyltransferase [Roseibium aggregatum]|uniref:FkbM family methyltransferase n=1 Tax=Roseibium aggregatum TaxID=187304 RepID=UPI003A974499
MFESYAQNYEDLYLWRCFGDKKEGTYIDAGASEPSKWSPSYAFYLAGWKGILVEPIPERIKEIKALRPNDILIEAALSSDKSASHTTFYRSSGRGGTSTIVEERGQQMQGRNSQTPTIMVPLTTLSSICEQHLGKAAGYDFLKLDIEGAELMALQGADLAKWRPGLIQVEAPEKKDDDLDMFLSGQGYLNAHYDGVNRYYVTEANRHMTAILQRPISHHDDFARVDAMNSPLKNMAHMDNDWAMSLGNAAIKAVASLSGETLAQIYVAGMPGHALQEKVDRTKMISAYRRVFGKKPSAEVVDLYMKKEMNFLELVTALVKSDEYLERRGRSIASF